MPLSRPSLAFAGSAAVLVVAGIVSHQVLLAPPAPFPELAELTASSPGGVAVSSADAVSPGVAALPDSAPSGESMVSASSVASTASEPYPAARAHSDESPVAALAVKGLERLERIRDAEATGIQGHLAPLSPGQEPVTSPSSGGTGLASPSPEDALLARSAALPGDVSMGMHAERSLNADMRRMVPPAPTEWSPGGHPAPGGNRFAEFAPNPVKVVAEEPVSTFSIDVDTASYAHLRASLNRGDLPHRDAVRTEELVNYFPYDYAPPETPETPFATHVSLMPAPWNDATRLLHIGIKGYELARSTAPRANLVFLIDTSGSMDMPNKLPLLVHSFRLLLDALAPEDRVAIVTYAGSAGVALAPTPVSDRGTILASLEDLHAGGSTAGAAGIREAYRLAERHRVEDGVNRVILATDGDFNVGITDAGELEDYIARKRASGVFLSVLGFGTGNYNDALMQRLAQNGNGNAAYIDTLSEARKVLVEEAGSTLFPIAKDVKIQVEFNPAAVSEYRLIGFETRLLAREDFRDDKIDAGEIGAGHTVTALYEITPVGSGAERVAPLRYRPGDVEPAAQAGDEIAFLKIRYKLPDADTSTLIARPVTAAGAFRSVDAAPRDVRFSAAVAAFGQLLRGGRYTGEYGYDDVVALALGARGDDPFGYRNEFVALVRLARSLTATERHRAD